MKICFSARLNKTVPFDFDSHFIIEFVFHALANGPELDIHYSRDIICIHSNLTQFRTSLRVPKPEQVELWRSSASVSLGVMISCLCAAGLGKAQTPCHAPTRFICYGLNVLHRSSTPSSFFQTIQH